ncbi:MAG: AMP-binding protein [Sinobacterium sp.]|nr:AMP-binding protein [Sinobacterium sp.]
MANEPVKEVDNLCRHLKNAAIHTPSDLAVAVQKARFGQLSYDEINFKTLDERSDFIAHALNAYGIKKGMKAVLMVTPSIDFFALTFALFKAGIIPILVDPGMGIKNLKQCFIESQPDVFIGIPKAQLARKLFSWGKGSIKIALTVGGNEVVSRVFGQKTLEKILQEFPSSTAYPMVNFLADDMSAMLFTSGSTGSPKGVVYTNSMFEAQINALKHDYAIKSGERDLATFPLFSLFGPGLGMASIVPEMDASKPIKANPEYIFAAIEKYQCSNLFANPALIEVLGQAGKQKKHKLKSLTRVISAGAPATLPSIAIFSQMLNESVEIITSYGATESLPITKIGSKALLESAGITNKGGGICVGEPVEGVELAIIKITDDNIASWSHVLDSGLCLGKNQIGEIVVKGPMVSKAYYARDSASRAAKITDGEAIRHRMGDLGYIDEQGRLWMCGRKSHRVETTTEVFYSIPCERIFNTHAEVKRTALVAVIKLGIVQPVLCVELEKNSKLPQHKLFEELAQIGASYSQTKTITQFIVHPNFPVDIRHNAKIFREKLAVWAQKEIVKK